MGVINFCVIFGVFILNGSSSASIWKEVEKTAGKNLVALNNMRGSSGLQNIEPVLTSAKIKNPRKYTDGLLKPILGLKDENSSQNLIGKGNHFLSKMDNMKNCIGFGLPIVIPVYVPAATTTTTTTTSGTPDARS
ncbi:uncharacterized protein LOC123686097 [Harmonia axyridis]|uniref:uncharacterized protein LOC123686097 n=1 Tax=Harmonia axyridis TaxID=115357 RepID=UPI001E278B2D|nr:uncharacterized protein LOC123686097 [Harmonia axyridis]